MNPTTPTREPTASDGCVHIAFMSLQSQTNNYHYYTVPSFGSPGDQIYYNVTVILAGGFGYIITSADWSETIRQQSLSTPSKFGPFSVLSGDSGVSIMFYPYEVGSYFRATVCPFEMIPTSMPTQIPAHGKSLTSFALSTTSHLVASTFSLSFC